MYRRASFAEDQLPRVRASTLSAYSQGRRASVQAFFGPWKEQSRTDIRIRAITFRTVNMILSTASAAVFSVYKIKCVKLARKLKIMMPEVEAANILLKNMMLYIGCGPYLWFVAILLIAIVVRRPANHIFNMMFCILCGTFNLLGGISMVRYMNKERKDKHFKRYDPKFLHYGYAAAVFSFLSAAAFYTDLLFEYLIDVEGVYFRYPSKRRKLLMKTAELTLNLIVHLIAMRFVSTMAERKENPLSLVKADLLVHMEFEGLVSLMPFVAMWLIAVLINRPLHFFIRILACSACAFLSTIGSLILIFELETSKGLLNTYIIIGSVLGFTNAFVFLAEAISSCVIHRR